MYIRREIEGAIDAMLAQGKVVLLTGARQVGKTTVLQRHLGDRYNYVTMEDPIACEQAKEDALLFFDVHALPLIIDEVQRAPELFSLVKLVVDQSSERGRIVLSGSQTYHLMKGVSESLAGRVRILEMSGLSLRELSGCLDGSRPYVPSKIDLPVDAGASDRAMTNEKLWEVIHRGSMPELQDSAVEWEPFYRDYVRAYLERDVRDLVNVRDEARFYNFMVACAARSGQLLNTSDIGKVVDADHKTVKSWVLALQASGIVRVLQPFWPNVDKRLSKMPKLYFMDTGLVCYLTRWTTAAQLRNGAAAGHMFETFVVSEVFKSHMNAGADLHDLWFYRDGRKHEIDLIVQEGRTIHPVEVKLGVQVRRDAVSNFRYLEDMEGYEVGFGHVVCQTTEPYSITSDVQAVPVWAI